jgi:hypothetical protein
MYSTLLRSLILGLALAALPAVASAQALYSAGPAPVQYTLIPETPGPSTSVTISVAGVGTFVGNSNITWSVDGTTAAQGVGLNKFKFTTGALGHTTTVKVTINSTEYGTITNTWTFNPSLINLVWEAHTTTPPMFMGHALYSKGSRLTVFAFPQVMKNGSRIPDSQLSFQWQLDEQPQPDASGLGRNTFSFQGNQLHTAEEVSVDVYSGSSVVGHADLTIPSTDPQLVMYPRDPLRGILYNSALGGSYTLPGEEVTVHAEPYYFSGTSATGSQYDWKWTLNGNPTSGPDAGKGEMTLRTQGGQKGTAILGVSLQNNAAYTYLQSAENSISLTFGGQTSSSVFGL